MKIRLDYFLLFTVPLGYFAPWMNWLAWINIVILGLLMVAVSVLYLMIFVMPQHIKINEITSDNSVTLKGIWAKVVFISTLAMSYYAGWENSVIFIASFWTLSQLLQPIVKKKIARIAELERGLV